MKRLLATACAVFLAASLTACATGAEEERAPAAEPVQEVEPTPTPTPEPTEEPFVLTECSGLPSVKWVADLEAEGGQLFTGETAEGLAKSHRENSIGPVAQESFAQATQTLQCSWGFPASDVFTSLLVAELPVDVRDHFMAELDGSVYERSTSDGVTQYRWIEDVGYTEVEHLHLFVGDIWIGETAVHFPPVSHDIMVSLREQYPSIEPEA
ncbi:MAG: hypothetical protein ACTHW3_02125 [Leucobacter sp.]